MINYRPYAGVNPRGSSPLHSLKSEVFNYTVCTTEVASQTVLDGELV